jgi:hypothetical protein
MRNNSQFQFFATSSKKAVIYFKNIVKSVGKGNGGRE